MEWKEGRMERSGGGVSVEIIDRDCTSIDWLFGKSFFFELEHYKTLGGGLIDTLA